MFIAVVTEYYLVSYVIFSSIVMYVMSLLSTQCYPRNNLSLTSHSRSNYQGQRNYLALCVGITLNFQMWLALTLAVMKLLIRNICPDLNYSDTLSSCVITPSDAS